MLDDQASNSALILASDLRFRHGVQTEAGAYILYYTSAIFPLYKVNCADWVGNFINFEPNKFGYYLVNFIEFKIPNYTASRYIYTRWDNYLNW